MKLFKFLFLIALFFRPHFANAVILSLEDQMDKVQEGISDLIDEREQTVTGTLRYEVLEKNIGQLETGANQTRIVLDQWEAATNPTAKEVLARKAKDQLEQMREKLIDLKNGW